MSDIILPLAVATQSSSRMPWNRSAHCPQLFRMLTAWIQVGKHTSIHHPFFCNKGSNHVSQQRWKLLLAFSAKKVQGLEWTGQIAAWPDQWRWLAWCVCWEIKTEAWSRWNCYSPHSFWLDIPDKQWESCFWHECSHIAMYKFDPFSWQQPAEHCFENCIHRQVLGHGVYIAVILRSGECRHRATPIGFATAPKRHWTEWAYVQGRIPRVCLEIFWGIMWWIAGSGDVWIIWHLQPGLCSPSSFWQHGQPTTWEKKTNTFARGH